MEYKKAIEFFLQNTPIKENDILKIKKIKKGFTNESYFLKTKNNGNYLIRFSSNKLLDRKLEKDIYDKLNIDYICFKQNGNLIKKWIVANHFKFWTKKKLILFVEALKKINNIQLKSIPKFNPYVFFDRLNKDKEKDIINIYTSLVNKHKNDSLTVCHSDLNPNNILYNSHNKKIYIIDFEWIKLNNIYWELANFSREKLSKKQMIFLLNQYGLNDFDCFHDYLIMTSLYAYQWSLSVEQTKKIKKYQKHIFKRLTYLKKIKFN